MELFFFLLNKGPFSVLLVVNYFVQTKELSETLNSEYRFAVYIYTRGSHAADEAIISISPQFDGVRLRLQNFPRIQWIFLLRAVQGV